MGHGARRFFLALLVVAAAPWVSAAETIVVRLTPGQAAPSASIPGMPFEGRLSRGDRELVLRLWDTAGLGRVAEACGEHDDPFSAAVRLQYVDPDLPDASLWFPLARIVAIDGAVYQAETATTGDGPARPVDLRLTPVEDPLYPVHLTGTGVVSVLVCSGDRYLRVRPVAGQISLPAGAWQLRECVVREDGVDYVARATPYGGGSPETRNWTNTATVEVKADETNEAALGGPIRRQLTVRGQWLGPLALSLAGFTGCASRSGTLTYDPPGIDRKNPPRWEVRRPGGRVLAAGTFEYG